MYDYFWKNSGVSVSEARTIASVLSGKLKVRIKEGEKWLYDFDKNAIEYRPQDLKVLTQTDVTANLLHEAGHAKYSTSPRELKWVESIPSNHLEKLNEVVNLMEDFRVEDILRASYPYAIDYLPDYSFKTLSLLNSYQKAMVQSDGKIPKFLQYLIGGYCQIAGDEYYLYTDMDEDVSKAVQLTKDVLIRGRFSKNTQEIADIIQKEIYEIIKPFLDDFDERKAMELKMMIVDGEPPLEPYEDLYPDVKGLIQRTAAMLNRVLTDVKFDKFSGNYTRGQKLNNRKLYRFGTGNFRLFQRREEASSKKYTFTLLVDESGSMRGEKMKNAIRGAILFSHALEKLHIPYGIYGFNDDYHDYKPIDKNPPDKKIFGQMWDQASSYEAGWNNDGYAVRRTAEKLLQKDATKRVMFVITDGRPCPSREYYDYDLIKEVKRAEDAGVEAVGIGIGYEQEVADYYKTHLVVDKVEEIPNAILKALKSKMKKGH